MIRESHLDANLNRLSTVFGSQLVIRPPASAEEVAQLERLVGPLPREFAMFLLTCDGLRVRTTPMTVVPQWQLWHVQEIVSSIHDPQGPGTSLELLPFCGDPTAIRDCLVTGRGQAEGAVVRWDPCTRDVELISSGFGCYFDRWTDYKIEAFASGGKGGLRPGAPGFDASYVGARDPQLAVLRNQKPVIESLHALDHIVGSGDDYE